MKHKSLSDFTMRSPLQDAFLLRPKKRVARRKLVAVIVLTSLVDAFSILLLYLFLQNSANDSSLDLLNPENLPRAVKSESVHEGTLVRIEGSNYFVSGEPVALDELAQKLQELQESLSSGWSADENATALVIQADRAASFSDLSPVIRAGSITGFNKFRFAVVQAEPGEEGHL